jgi:hypothetical protein
VRLRVKTAGLWVGTVGSLVLYPRLLPPYYLRPISPQIARGSVLGSLTRVVSRRIAQGESICKCI